MGQYGASLNPEEHYPPPKFIFRPLQVTIKQAVRLITTFSNRNQQGDVETRRHCQPQSPLGYCQIQQRLCFPFYLTFTSRLQMSRQASVEGL